MKTVDLAAAAAANENPQSPLAEVDKSKARRAPLSKITFPKGTVVPVAPASSGKSIGCMIPVEVDCEVILRADDGQLFLGRLKMSQGWASVDPTSVRKYTASQG